MQLYIIGLRTLIYECVTELKKIGLEDNRSKCETIIISYPVDEFTELVKTASSDHSAIKKTELAAMKLLGSSILHQAVKKAIADFTTSHVAPYDPPPKIARHAHGLLLKHSLSHVSFSHSTRPMLPSF